MTLTDSQTSSLNINNEEKEKSTLKKDRAAIWLLFVLYTVQAIPQGLIFVSIPVTLMSKGAKFTDLWVISLSYIPFCFKSFLSPLLNKYYIKALGKGKTYLIPSYFIIVAILLFLAQQGDGLFEITSIPMLNVVSIITILTLIPADISLDGWMVSLISSENSSGAIAQSIGFNLGFFLSFNLFLPLSSVEFCNKYIYSENQTAPLINNTSYITGLALFIFLATLWVLFFLQEKEKESNSSVSASEIMKTLKIFLVNPHFRKLFFIYATWNIIFGPIHNLFPAMILEKGISKELFTNLNTPITPLLFIITFWLGNLCKRFPETRIANGFWISRLFATFFIYGTIVYLHLIPEGLKTPILFFASLLTSVSFNGVSIALGVFANRVAKETYGGPILSTFGAIGSFSRLLSDIFVFTFVHYLGWNNIAVLTLMGTFGYATIFIKGLNSFEKKSIRNLIVEKSKLE